MNRLFCVFLLSLFVLPLDAQPRKKVGVVLSGGGAKGVAHIGALRVIEEAGIPIDLVVGTSMGAIVGGLYAIGYTPHQMDSMVRKQDWEFLLSDRINRKQKTFLEKVEAEKYVISVPFYEKPKPVGDGIVKGQNLNNLFTDLTIGYHDSIDFYTLPIPFACVAVDIMEGKEVVFHRGKLAEAMRASMAIPAAFTPVRIDSLVLIDGGLLNNFPVDVARSMGAEVIIGVDVQSDPEDKAKVASLIDMVHKLTDIAGKDKYAKNQKDTDFYIKVDVKGYNAASFAPAALDTLTARGEVAARAKWEQFGELKRKIGIKEGFIPEYHEPYASYSKGTPIFIRNISFSGAGKSDLEELHARSKLRENTYMTMDELRNAVDNLYALQTYTNINYNLTKMADGYDLEVTLEENNPNYLSLGVRFDTEEVAAVQLNGFYQLKTPIPTRIVFTGRLGMRSSARLDYLIYPTRLRYLKLSYMFQYNDINIYYRGNREYNTTYGYHFAEFGYSNILNRNMRVGLGLRYEYFDYKTFLYNKAENIVAVKPEGFFSYYALLRYETMDKKSFPTKGMSLQASVSVYTDDLTGYNDHPPFGSAGLWWEGAFSPTRSFSMLPSFFGRVLFGQDSPYPVMNALGGDTPGRYVSQQIPFTGISYVDIVSNSVLVGRLKLRQRIGKKNYASLTVNYGLTDNHFGDILKGKQLFGIGVGYSYDSLFGPIEASFSVSNRTNQLGFYGNLGYRF